MERYKRSGVFLNGMPFSEKYWRWSGEGPEVAHQVGGTCAYHVLANVTECHHRIWHKKNNQPLPFKRLSVEHLYNRTIELMDAENVKECVAKKTATNIIRDEGILPAELYCAPHGLRGEYRWTPTFLIPEEILRCRVKANGTWIEMQDPELGMTPDKKREYIVELLKVGPVYADFFPILQNGEYENNKGFPHGFLTPTLEKLPKTPSHSIMLVGYGKYNVGRGVWARYFIYLNTYSVYWGDKGFGRILADGMKGIYSVWFPNMNIVPPLNPSGSTSGSD